MGVVASAVSFAPLREISSSCVSTFNTSWKGRSSSVVPRCKMKWNDTDRYEYSMDERNEMEWVWMKRTKLTRKDLKSRRLHQVQELADSSQHQAGTIPSLDHLREVAQIKMKALGDESRDVREKYKA